MSEMDILGAEIVLNAAVTQYAELREMRDSLHAKSEETWALLCRLNKAAQEAEAACERAEVIVQLARDALERTRRDG